MKSNKKEVKKPVKKEGKFRFSVDEIEAMAMLTAINVLTSGKEIDLIAIKALVRTTVIFARK